MAFTEIEDVWPLARDPRTPLLPPPRYDEIRAMEEPVVLHMYDDLPAVMLTRYEDVRTLLQSPDVSNDGRLPGFPYTSASTRAGRGNRITIDRLDPPVHDEQRAMLAATFTMKRVREYRPFVEQAVDGLLDNLEKAGQPADFVKIFAEALPAIVICRVLELPMADAPRLRELVRRWSDDAGDPDDITLAAQELTEFYEKVIEERRGGEGTDLISNLIRNQLETGALTLQQLVMTCQLLTTAGFDTTTNAIALGTLALLQNPGDWAELAADETGELVVTATEELLRYLSVAHANHLRLAKADIPIGHTVIPSGTAIVAVQAAGNHDPERFPDPHRLDIHRDARGHLAFSSGLHQCLGQQLARLELHVVFERLPKRFPNLTLDVPMEDLAFRPNQQVYGVRALPVRW